MYYAGLFIKHHWLYVDRVNRKNSAEGIRKTTHHNPNKSTPALTLMHPISQTLEYLFQKNVKTLRMFL